MLLLAAGCALTAKTVELDVIDSRAPEGVVYATTTAPGREYLVGEPVRAVACELGAPVDFQALLAEARGKYTTIVDLTIERHLLATCTGRGSKYWVGRWAPGPLDCLEPADPHVDVTLSKRRICYTVAGRGAYIKPE